MAIGRENAERGQRPVAEPRPPHDVLDEDRPEVPGVRRALAVVAHHKQGVGGDGPGRGLVMSRRRLGRPVDSEQVRLVEHDAIDENLAVLDDDPIPGDADDPLDVWLAGLDLGVRGW